MHFSPINCSSSSQSLNILSHFPRLALLEQPRTTCCYCYISSRPTTCFALLCCPSTRRWCCPAQSGTLSAQTSHLVLCVRIRPCLSSHNKPVQNTCSSRLLLLENSILRLKRDGDCTRRQSARRPPLHTVRAQPRSPISPRHPVPHLKRPE